MNKKLYSAPKVTKVRLEVKQSVLGTCNLTTDTTPGYGAPHGTTGCQTAFCFQ